MNANEKCPTCGSENCQDIYHAPNPISESSTRLRVLQEVSKERDRQNEKWGGNSLHTVHDPLRALAVLTEEVGEVAREVVEWSAWKDKDPEEAGERMARYRQELIEVSAVAVAMVQAFDAGKEEDDDGR